MTAVGVVTAVFGAVTTTLDAAQRSEQAQTAADHYLALPSDARIAHRIDLLDPAEPAADRYRTGCQRVTIGMPGSGRILPPPLT
jgi:hypothetical protein